MLLNLPSKTPLSLLHQNSSPLHLLHSTYHLLPLFLLPPHPDLTLQHFLSAVLEVHLRYYIFMNPEVSLHHCLLIWTQEKYSVLHKQHGDHGAKILQGVGLSKYDKNKVSIVPLMDILPEEQNIYSPVYP